MTPDYTHLEAVARAATPLDRLHAEIAGRVYSQLRCGAKFVVLDCVELTAIADERTALLSRIAELTARVESAEGENACLAKELERINANR